MIYQFQIIKIIQNVQHGICQWISFSLFCITLLVFTHKVHCSSHIMKPFHYSKAPPFVKSPLLCPKCCPYTMQLPHKCQTYILLFPQCCQQQTRKVKNKRSGNKPKQTYIFYMVWRGFRQTL
jgi:hypothetical protein